MDAPPPQEDCRPFVHAARVLREAGVNVPEVLAADLEQGFLLLGDFGNTTYLAGSIAQSAPALYGDATQALVTHADGQPAGRLRRTTRASCSMRELMLFPQWYLARHKGVELTARAAPGDATRPSSLILQNNLAQPPVFVHRDYHSRNLMVLDGDAQSRHPRLPGRGLRPDHLRPGLAAARRLHPLGRGAGAGLGDPLLGEGARGRAAGATRLRRRSIATSNGWGCSAT